MARIPVIVVIDVGKTNKKIFVFDERYRIVYERSARFIETSDEDGDPCENLESLRLSVYDSLREVFKKKDYEIKAINFCTYGASFVYVNEYGQPLAPLYNYLKKYPEALSKDFYETYGGETAISLATASPVLGSLNSGMQLYRIKKERPELFAKIKYALHLPQYLSYLISGQFYTDLTSVGCHTQLWDFTKNEYHNWVKKEGLAAKFAEIKSADSVFPAEFPGNNYFVGTGLHDSSAALIPYLVNFRDPFVLISTGTWCISLNPFNDLPLTDEELKKDCLCYLQYQGKPVKASRIFAGYEHEMQLKRITVHFGSDTMKYRTMDYDSLLMREIIDRNEANPVKIKLEDHESAFGARDLSLFATDEEAYHQFMYDLVQLQYLSTSLALKGSDARRIFVDGGFSKNAIFMNMLAFVFPDHEVFAASMAQSTALGAALAIHSSWNERPIPNDIIELKYFSVPQHQRS
ncbi:FGGY-family carbohydrate kinase [Pedobacter metabolipauper]|uniref:Sugar (Pentulose or hexulose) kinase n=1 Tax=Pedobacter metabolipauper TaxID=425513 RepID=A0A4R6SRU7_9SPHI|nr:FGGY family carbohydrate kinase [Pedobacter metabolipauper]TDQ06954.1 sugar (pentulose or hexulose) kinase [Pedobacter metabolipauper]